jgi:3-mercaptopyruvate sulfurtransferase SseA
MIWKTSIVAAALLTASVAQAQLAKGAPSAPVATQTVAPAADQHSAKRITRDEAISKVKAKTAIFVDVRAKDQYEIGHIKGSINIPLTELMARLKELPKNKMIITYCA